MILLILQEEDIEGGNPLQARRATFREADVDAWVRASQHLRDGMTVEEVPSSHIMSSLVFDFLALK